MLLFNLLLYSWLAQIGFYIFNFFYLKWRTDRIFAFLFFAYLLIPIVVVYFRLYPTTLGGTCGTEIFNPIIVFSIWGNLGNLLILSGGKILSMILNKFGYGE